MPVNPQVRGATGPQLPAPALRVPSHTRVRALPRRKPDVKGELVLGAHVQLLLGGELQQTSLIDTGATIFAAAPRKCFPAGVLELARTPLSLSTVTSGSIEGGKYGAWSNVQMPICSEAGGEWVMCPRVFIYCAEVSDGLIFGYPFLEAFRLMVCPVSACLMPRECVSVHPQRVLLNRGTEQVPFKGFVKNIQSVADSSGKLEAPACLSHSGCMQGSAPGGAGPSCLYVPLHVHLSSFPCILHCHHSCFVCWFTRHSVLNEPRRSRRMSTHLRPTQVQLWCACVHQNVHVIVSARNSTYSL